MIYGLGTMVPRLLNYIILTPYFTYNLFKDSLIEYGKVTELYAYMAFLMIVLTYGMETAYFRFVTKENDKNKVYSTILTSIIFSSVIFIIGVFVFTNGISTALAYKGEQIFIRLLAGILVVEAISAIPFAKLRVENKAKKFALLKFVQVIVNIGLMLGIYNVLPKFLGSDFISNSAGEISAKFIFIANMAASSVVLVLLAKEFKGYRLGMFEFSYLKPILLYGLPLMISGLAGTINETLDRSIYKHLIENKDIALTELGIYGANYKIGGLILIFIQMFRYAAEPYFFSKSKDIDAKDQYANLMNIFTGIIVIMGLVIVLFLNYFKIFIGENFREGLFVVPYIVLGYILYGVLFNLSVWFKLSDQTKYAFIIMLFGALITIGINIVYVPVYRYGASAVAHVCSYGAMVILSYFLGKKFYRIDYNVGRVLLYIGLGIGIYIASLKMYIKHEILEVGIKALAVLLFAIFVAWKENILSYIKK